MPIHQTAAWVEVKALLKMLTNQQLVMCCPRLPRDIHRWSSAWTHVYTGPIIRKSGGKPCLRILPQVWGAGQLNICSLHGIARRLASLQAIRLWPNKSILNDHSWLALALPWTAMRRGYSRQPYDGNPCNNLRSSQLCTE